MEARQRVEPTDVDKENAQEAHRLVRSFLETDSTLKEYEVDTTLIGSYARQVSIRRVKDVDALCKLPGLMGTVDSSEILSSILDLLDEEFKDARVTPQDRSIKVKFPDFDMHVDVVPARTAGSYLEIPDGEGGWLETNPEKFTELTKKMNLRYDDRYVPLVKLIRQTRRTCLGKRPGGFLFEVMTYHACDAGIASTSDAALYAGALRSIATQLGSLAAGGLVPDPTRPGSTINVRATELQLATAATKFATVAGNAESAFAENDRCSSARQFCAILGKNADDEWVFGVPADCNEDGTARKLSVTMPGDRFVPAGDGRFA
ncbi:MAG: hypothetical protein ACHP7H_00270 [Hyphomicrobiales bacterium]